MLSILKLNKCKYGISYRGPFFWNNFLSTTDKQITDIVKSKAVTKSKLLFIIIVIIYFTISKKHNAIVTVGIV